MRQYVIILLTDNANFNLVPFAYIIYLTFIYIASWASLMNSLAQIMNSGSMFRDQSTAFF